MESGRNVYACCHNQCMDCSIGIRLRSSENGLMTFFFTKETKK